LVNRRCDHERCRPFGSEINEPRNQHVDRA
jgi:hypothetical protein